MCLITRSKPRIAIEDVYVIKYLVVGNGNLCSPYFEFIWEIGKPYRAIMFPREGPKCLIYEGGFHAYINHIIFFEDATAYVALIPKGTKFVCSDSEVVAEQMIIVEEVQHFTNGDLPLNARKVWKKSRPSITVRFLDKIRKVLGLQGRKTKFVS